MDVDERLSLITRNTQEVILEDELRSLLLSKDHPKAYIGFAPTGRMHVGYMIPVRKVVDFLRAGCEFTFLIADLHAYLDDNKTPWELLDARYTYYKQGIIGLLKAFNAPVDKVSFVRGSDFEFDRTYMEHVLQMVGDVTLHRAKRAASEVVRFKEDPKLGGFVYPLLQIEDVYALNADICFGGIDQRGIYMLGRDLAERMNRRKYVCVFSPLLPGLTGSKMSASDENSKIDLLDEPDVVVSKMKKAYCPEKEVDGNGVLSFIEHVLAPLLFDKGEVFLISRPEKFGGDVSFLSFDELRNAYVKGLIHPLDLKLSVSNYLNKLLSVVRANIDVSLLDKAYP